MNCPLCGKRCSQHENEVGTWYDCPDHGCVKIVQRLNKGQRALHWEEYLDAMERHEEATQ